MRVSSRRSMPRSGSKEAMRARPESMTVRTPSMVREVSAMLVARMIFVRPWGSGARALAGLRRRGSRGGGG